VQYYKSRRSDKMAAISAGGSGYTGVRRLWQPGLATRLPFWQEMHMAAVIRLATADDAQAVQGIYAPLVRDTVISFEVEPPSVPVPPHELSVARKSAAWKSALAAGTSLLRL
jgi:hypothetical protein